MARRRHAWKHFTGRHTDGSPTHVEAADLGLIDGEGVFTTLYRIDGGDEVHFSVPLSVVKKHGPFRRVILAKEFLARNGVVHDSLIATHG